MTGLEINSAVLKRPCAGNKVWSQGSPNGVILNVTVDIAAIWKEVNDTIYYIIDLIEENVLVSIRALILHISVSQN